MGQPLWQQDAERSESVALGGLSERRVTGIEAGSRRLTVTAGAANTQVGGDLEAGADAMSARSNQGLRGFVGAWPCSLASLPDHPPIQLAPGLLLSA